MIDSGGGDDSLPHKVPPLRVKPMDTNVSVMCEEIGRLLIQAVSLAIDARNAESKDQKPQQSPRDAM